MNIEFDPAKECINISKHGLSLALGKDFDWASSLVVEDTRHDYHEPRFIALGVITKRVHAVVFTMRSGNIRVISLRKANKREVRRYERS